MRSAWLAPLAVVACAQPVSAGQPTQYSDAVAARQAGRPGEAKRLLLDWLSDHPDDIDARLQLAYANLALGELSEANADFEAVLRMAPDYADAREGVALVAARREFADQGKGPEFSLTGALSELSGSSSDWTEVAAIAAIPVGNGILFEGTGAYYRRFNLTDVEINGQISWPASESIQLRVRGGGTPHADFRPRFAIGAGLDARLSRGNATVLTLDGRFERFPSQDVYMVSPGLVQYLADGRAWVSVRGTGVVAEEGALQIGGMVRADYSTVKGLRLFSGAANGPDTDLGVVTRVTSLFGGIEFPIAPTWRVGGAVSKDWRDSGQDRTEVRLTLTAGL